MSNKKDMEPYNEKGQPHGYWERYYENGTFWGKATYHNGIPVGYDEYHDSYDGHRYKTFHIR